MCTLVIVLRRVLLPLQLRLTGDDACVGLVSDHRADKERVEERLQHATDEPTTGVQHFWLSGYNVHTLATLKDHACQGILLLELCQSTLSRINEVMFPTGPQQQGIDALLGIICGVGPIRNFIIERLVMGANATMAYIRSQRPSLMFRSPVIGSSLSQ